MLRKIEKIQRHKAQVGANGRSPLRSYILAILSGIILSIPFSNGKLWILAWFGFLPLLFALNNKSRRQSFLLCYLCGLVFWWLTIYWLVNVTALGTAVLIFYLALYFGVFGFLISYSKSFSAFNRLFFLASIWVVLEYIRSHLFTGFGWALLGYSQCLNLPVIQVSDITGAWGVSFAVILFNLTLWSAIKNKKKHPLAFFTVFAFIFYGLTKIFCCQFEIPESRLKISVIQGNIPQELKWQPEARGQIMDRQIGLSFAAAGDNPQLVIWPEASLPVIPQADPAYLEVVRNFSLQTRIPVLLGAVTKDNQDRYYNSALLIPPQENGLLEYRKIHLVPFGEYVPLKNVFPFLEGLAPIGDITRGKRYTIFRAGQDFSVLICFEDVFPGLSRRFTRLGAKFLVNITNDAWYGQTSASFQHLQASIFRAVENRVNVVRSANTGISAFIAPSGQIISAVCSAKGKNIFVEGFKTQEIGLYRQMPSFYTRFGDVFILLCLILFFWALRVS